MNRKNIKSQGDIFISNRNTRVVQTKHTKKPPHWLTTTGLVTLILIIVFGINTAVALERQELKQAQHATYTTTTNKTPAIYKVLPKESLPQTNTVALAQATTSHSQFNTNPINVAPLNTNQTQPANFNNFVNQINQLQTQIAQRMQSCAQLGAQVQTQVSQLRAQEEQRKARVNDINRALSDLSGSDPNVQAQRERLRQQRETIIFERNQLRNEINAARSQYNFARSECNRAINNMNNTKRSLENEMNKAYRTAINVKLY